MYSFSEGRLQTFELNHAESVRHQDAANNLQKATSGNGSGAKRNAADQISSSKDRCPIGKHDFFTKSAKKQRRTIQSDANSGKVSVGSAI